MPVDPVRDAAIDVLLRVFERGVHLDVSLDKTLQRKTFSDRGRRFLQQLVYGTTRNITLCDHVLRPLCHQPLEELPLAIRLILQMAAFQSLFCAQVTHPAMVHTSVDLAKKRGHAGIARMCNAILRKVPETLDDVRLPKTEKDFRRYLEVRYSMPRWLLDRYLSELPGEAVESLCKRMNTQAELCMRVNTMKIDAPTLAQKFEQSGVFTGEHPDVPNVLVFLEGKNPIHTKWFQQGLFQIQDPASILPGHLLGANPGEKILDMCSAPGGKTTHLAELGGDKATIFAMDAKWNRLFRVRENVERMEFENVHIFTGDGESPPLKPGFDAVLLDAPCSGLGTLRRHPDIKWHCTPESIGRISEIQGKLLRSAINLCNNGGRIVYSVCTQTQEETHNVIAPFLAEGFLAPEDGPEWMNTWKCAPGQYRTNPSSQALDGFFLMRLRKLS